MNIRDLKLLCTSRPPLGTCVSESSQAREIHIFTFSRTSLYIYSNCKIESIYIATIKEAKEEQETPPEGGVGDSCASNDKRKNPIEWRTRKYGDKRRCFCVSLAGRNSATFLKRGEENAGISSKTSALMKIRVRRGEDFLP